MDMTGNISITMKMDTGVVKELEVEGTVTDVSFNRTSPVATPVMTITMLPDEHPKWQTTYMPPFEWRQGPTEEDSDPAKMWHVDCGGEVYYLGGAHHCAKCKLSSTDRYPE